MAASREAAKALEDEKVKFDEERKGLRADKEKAVEEAREKNKAVIKTLTEDKGRLAGEMASLKKAFDLEKAGLLDRQRESAEKVKQESAAARKTP